MVVCVLRPTWAYIQPLLSKVKTLFTHLWLVGFTVHAVHARALTGSTTITRIQFQLNSTSKGEYLHSVL